jgi:phage FluMu protein Com
MIDLEIPNGWGNLFIQMCDDLKEVLIKEGYLDTFYFIQIKEKYNQLRCYAGHPTTHQILQVLHKYEYLSQFVCSKCGKPAIKETTQGYIESFCDDCWKTQQKRYAVRDTEFNVQFEIMAFGRSTGHIKTIIDVSDEWNRYLKRLEA